MKKIVFLLMFVLPITFLNAQSYPCVKIYGFKQAVTGGMRPSRTITEDNKTVEATVKQKNNYWFYLTCPQKAGAQPTEIYISGNKYSVKTEVVKHTPVLYTDNKIPSEPKTTVMVPQTKHKVLFVIPQEPQSFKASATLKNKLAANEVVIGYTVKGKKYYGVLKNMTRLEPALMQ